VLRLWGGRAKKKGEKEGCDRIGRKGEKA
jgi:hypothetical protein